MISKFESYRPARVGWVERQRNPSTTIPSGTSLMGFAALNPSYGTDRFQRIAELVREFLADTDRGALLRETSPVFYVLAGAEREQALARARQGTSIARKLAPMIMQRNKVDHALRAAAGVTGHDVLC